MKKSSGTADAFSKGITIEGAMKHSLYGKTLQDEPLEIGKDLADILYNLLSELKN